MAKSRYSGLSVVTDGKTLKKRYESFPKITSKEISTDSDITIVWDESMRLDALAAKYLGDGRYWWAICLANDLTFPFGQLRNGDLLIIPNSIDNIVTRINQNNR